MLNYRRAKLTDHHNDLKLDYVTRQTALVAVEDNQVVGILQYHFLTQMEIEIDGFVNDSNISEREVFTEFLEELKYWHPYLKVICISDELWRSYGEVFKELNFHTRKYHLNDHTLLHEVTLDEITPEQLSIDQEKLKACMKWVNQPEDIIVSCVIINQQLVCIDGYSRLIAAYEKALPHVYVHIEKPEDVSFYETCLSWCQSEGVMSIKDLASKVVTSEEHQRIWIDRCQNHLKSLEHLDRGEK